MKTKKRKKIFQFSRRTFFSAILFLLVFVAAGIIKVKAEDQLMIGWLWGGGVEQTVPPDFDLNSWDETNTNLRWISLNNNNPEISPKGTVSYSVNIPSDDGASVTGYGWSGGDDSGTGLGWIDFNPQDNHCVEAPAMPGVGQYQAKECHIPGDLTHSDMGGVKRSGSLLVGWARIVGIAQESAKNNSGGWSGWIHMDGSYGVDLTKMNGDTKANKTLGEMTFGTGGADELGWIDFSRAGIKSCDDPECSTIPPLCEGHNLGSSCDPTNFCSNDSYAICAITGDTTWSCTNFCGATTISCPPVPVVPLTDGKCNGDIDGKALCNRATLAESDLCEDGSPININPSPLNLNSYDISWDCEGICGGETVSCAARGKKTCGWVETNP